MWSTWDALALEVRRCLCDRSTDALSLAVIGPNKRRLDLRIDPVRVDQKVELWMSTLAPTPFFRQKYVATGAEDLRQSASAPLRPLRSLAAGTLRESILVWRCSGDEAAAETLRATLEGGMGIPANRLRLEQLECSPAELDRRIDGKVALIRRHVERRARGIPARLCEKCGQPLSDPVSVQIGIGPECLKYFSREVIEGIRLGRVPDADLARAKLPRE